MAVSSSPSSSSITILLLLFLSAPVWFPSPFRLALAQQQQENKFPMHSRDDYPDINMTIFNTSASGQISQV
jgi:hypothetical protein